MQPRNTGIVNHHGGVRRATDGGSAIDLELLPDRGPLDHGQSNCAECAARLVDGSSDGAVHSCRASDKASRAQTRSTLTMTQKSGLAAPVRPLAAQFSAHT